MNTRLDLIRACVESPDDDVPRLMLADWLDGEGHDATSVVCPKCVDKTGFCWGKVAGCPYCDNSGRIIQHGPCTSLAEFIRLSCKHDCEECGGRDFEVGPCGLTDYYRKCYACKSRREREDELLRTHESQWRRPVCEWCEGNGKVRDGNPDLSKSKWRECPQCKGIGVSGPLSDFFVTTGNFTGGDPKPGVHWMKPVQWVRGFPVITVQWPDVGRVVGNLDGASGMWMFGDDWLEWACRAVRECGASFSVQGKEPYIVGSSRMWCKQMQNEHPHTLPDVVFDELEGYTEIQPQKGALIMAAKYFNSLEFAHTALDHAFSRIVTRKAYEVTT